MTAQRSLSTPLCRQLGITHPIFGFSHSVDVTIAITLAGGFAVLGVARDDPEHIARAPRTLIETTRIFKESAIARDWLGDTFVDHFAATREWEWRQWLDSVTDWERKRYFEII